jgi:hypothetical protein
MCAVCLVVLVVWLQDHRRHRAQRKRREVRAGMSLEVELELRRRILDEVRRRR